MSDAAKTAEAFLKIASVYKEESNDVKNAVLDSIGETLTFLHLKEQLNILYQVLHKNINAMLMLSYIFFVLFVQTKKLPGSTGQICVEIYLS